MSCNLFESTLSDIAAIRLAEVISLSAKTDKSLMVPNSSINQINGSYVLSSMSANDPVKRLQSKPCAILSQENQNKLKNIYKTIYSEESLNNIKDVANNQLLSNKLTEITESNEEVYSNHSSLLALKIMAVNKTRDHLLQMENEGATKNIKELKVPTNIKEEADKLVDSIKNNEGFLDTSLLGDIFNKWSSGESFDLYPESIKQRMINLDSGINSDITKKLNSLFDDRETQLDERRELVEKANSYDLGNTTEENSSIAAIIKESTEIELLKANESDITGPS